MQNRNGAAQQAAKKMNLYGMFALRKADTHWPQSTVSGKKGIIKKIEIPTVTTQLAVLFCYC